MKPSTLVNGAATLGVLLLFSGPMASSSEATTASNVYRAASPSVVVVETQIGQGSGFAFSKPGYFLTNAHVVGPYANVLIRTTAGKTVAAKVLKVDSARDVALLQTGELDLSPLSAPTTRVETGDNAYAIGSPEGQESTLTQGIVSKAERRYRDQPWIQSDVAINHGNSGGPLLNDKGQVIGITTAVIEDSPGQRTEGMALAVPIGQAAKTMGIFLPEEAGSATRITEDSATGARRRTKSSGSANVILAILASIFAGAVIATILIIRRRRGGGGPPKSGGNSSRRSPNSQGTEAPRSGGSKLPSASERKAW